MALKIGTENRTKVIIAGGLGVVVLGLLLNAIFDPFGPRTPTPTPAQASVVQPTPATTAKAAPVQRETAHAGAPHEAPKIAGSMAALDPTLHPELMAQAESLEYTGNGRNIFSMFSAPVQIEQPKAPVRPQQLVAQVPQGPPPPPPIDLKFFGYEAQLGGVRKVFLLHGEDVFIAAEGDVVDHRYKVIKIAPFSLQIEDLPYNNTQTLPLIQN